MKTLSCLLAAGVLLAGADAANADAPSTAPNPLSVHVLNLQDGLPSPGVEVVLEKQEGEGWTVLNTGVTNEQGRIPALFPDRRNWAAGTYKVTFKTGKWFADHKTETFFPEIPVVFRADGKLAHYHIPLLLSPYGFSTYRGN
jgi:5-hydroxyisourate hydrolase